MPDRFAGSCGVRKFAVMPFTDDPLSPATGSGDRVARSSLVFKEIYGTRSVRLGRRSHRALPEAISDLRARAGSSEVDLTSDVNRSLKQRELERHQPDWNSPADKVARQNNELEHADFSSQPEDSLALRQGGDCAFYFYDQRTDPPLEACNDASRMQDARHILAKIGMFEPTWQIGLSGRRLQNDAATGKRVDPVSQR